jgi:NADH dehydrogenase
MVDSSLQSEDPNIFAMGDCACVLQADGKPVPPRAQAAHQQATHMFKALKARYKGQPMPEFVYKDKGSLVSLSGYSTIGSLMGNLSSGSMMIEGRLARFVYVSLYRMHQIALHGYWHTLLLSLVGHINKVIRPRLKLH